MKKKVLISACLLGEQCRYDGKTKINNEIIEKYKDCEIILFCPEAPVLGPPRERISVIFEDKQYKVIGDESKKDFTDEIIKQVNLHVENHMDLDEIILKSKSPSCGVGNTPILNTKREVLMFDDGIATQRLKEIFLHVEIKDELNI